MTAIATCIGQPDSQAPSAAHGIWSLSGSAVWSASEVRDGLQRSFWFDRPVNAVVLDDGRAVVGNRDHLVFVGKDGTAYAVAGRAGSGPLEFSRIHAVFATADGVAAYDLNRRRLLLFGVNAQPQGEIRVPPGIAGEVIGVEGSRSIVVWSRSRALPHDQLRIIDSVGNVSEAYGSWPQARRMAVPTVVSGMQSTIVHVGGCTAVNLAVVLGNTVFVAEQASGTVFSVTPSGQQRSLYELPARTIDAEFVRKRGQLPFGSRPGSQKVANDITASLGKVGDPFPYAWDRMLADPAGLLWLRRVECLPAFGERLWDIVDTAGGLRAQLHTRYQLLGINGRYALALDADSTTVSLLRIEAH